MQNTYQPDKFNLGFCNISAIFSSSYLSNTIHANIDIVQFFQASLELAR
jgi:hypothetical protein